MSIADLPFRIEADRRFVKDARVAFREHSEVTSQVESLAKDLERDPGETMRMVLRLGLQVARSVAPQKPQI